MTFKQKKNNYKSQLLSRTRVKKKINQHSINSKSYKKDIYTLKIRKLLKMTIAKKK